MAALDLETVLREGQALFKAGAWAPAEALFAQAIGQGVVTAGLLSNHGLMLMHLGRLDEAVEQQKRALALDPKLVAAWTNLALALEAADRLDEATQARHAAWQLAPDNPETQVNMGVSALKQGLPTAALEHFRSPVRQGASLPEAWINIGLACTDLADAATGCFALRRALDLSPAGEVVGDIAASNWLMSLCYQPDSSSAAQKAAAVQAGERWNRHPLLPAAASPAVERPGGGPLRIGYVGGDFREHPVGWMINPVLRSHDRQRVEVHVFNTREAVAAHDSIRPQLRAGADVWHEVARQDDAALARQIQDLGIDVLVDLAGHTEYGRPGVFARRPAPVQLAWLGYFGSTGLKTLDAVISSQPLAGPGAADFFIEPLALLPRLHLCYEGPVYAPEPSLPPEPGPGQVLRFASFNNLAKLSDACVALWARLLHQFPSSVLRLKWKSLREPATQALVASRFAVHGISPERLELRHATQHPEMLAEYGEVHVALDPFPFPGGLTTLEALWQGVPVVSLAWQRPVSRQGLALLDAVGLPECAVSTPDAYLRAVADLVASPEKRQALRFDLRQRIRQGPLGDGPGLARALEDLFEQQAAHARQAPTCA